MTDFAPMPLPLKPKVVRLRVMWPPLPPRGAYLRMNGVRGPTSAYHVLIVRKARPGSKSIATLICRKLLPNEIPADARHVIDWRWASRSKRPSLRSPLL